MSAQNEKLTVARVLQEIRKCGFTHVIWLPDTGSRPLYDALAREAGITMVPVCREGEALAIAAGLMWGGKNPLVLIQCTGFFESGDSVRGVAMDTRLPQLMMIGYRGWRRDAPVTDSAALFTEPIMDGWGIKHYLVECDDDAGKISLGFKESHETRKPVAILVGKEYSQL
ncbi:MAG: thiamine pyrophosphate-binding protein [Dehalococcoidales bacterium]|nr:thiamine pyrophosphate-binding protein [Dehalococcoidales bacterium]